MLRWFTRLDLNPLFLPITGTTRFRDTRWLRRRKTMKRSPFPMVVLLMLLGSGAAHATDISGTISSTLTIFEDSQLAGDVSCTMVGTPCVVFGAPDIVLSL